MGKLFKFVVAAAAVGSVCYVFKDKIKATQTYQTLGVDEKVEKVRTTLKEKIAEKAETERDYFTLNEDTVDEVTDAVADVAVEIADTAEAVKDTAADVIEEIKEDVAEAVPELA